MLYVALVGITLIIVRGTIFGPLQRLWPALFGCVQCTGMWVGISASAVDHGGMIDAILTGGAVSFLSLSADAVLLTLLGAPTKEAENATKAQEPEEQKRTL